ncbi:hypothetical protein PG997_014414 [Apiospora hydei]|uniref:Uncharacterized protein n=1 Tax=Apiospora hydei TaxID=1337664 RepID=A0ABR1UUF1_9PEZI
MHRYSLTALLLAHAGLGLGQDVTWCKDDKCSDCPSGLASSGPGWPECVVYDSNVVFGGQGFDEDVAGKLRYRVYGDFKEPCGGASGNFMIRSPASISAVGCGNLVYSTQKAQCSGSITLEDTFMVQFCCGAGDCDAAHVPAGKRGDDLMLSGGGSSGGGVYLQFPNGTMIEPLAVGTPPPPTSFATRRAAAAAAIEARACEGYKEGSASTSTTFEASVGDALGIISVSVGFTFENSTSDAQSIAIAVPAGQSGYIGWTPIYRCTKGSLETCDDVRTGSKESCTPYVSDGVIRGDYLFVQT